MDTTKAEYLKLPESDRFLWGYCDKELKEIRRGYAGAAHAINRCNADSKELFEAIEGLRGWCSQLEACGESSDAEIGKLREKVASLEASLEKARESYALLRDKVGS